MERRQRLTMKEVAHIYNVHRNTVRNWVMRGLLITERAGRRTYIIPREDGYILPPAEHKNCSKDDGEGVF